MIVDVDLFLYAILILTVISQAFAMMVARLAHNLLKENENHTSLMRTICSITSKFDFKANITNHYKSKQFQIILV